MLRLVGRVLSVVLAWAVALVVWAGPASAAEHPPGFISTWGTTGSGDGQFDSPSGVAVDGDGNVYVVDRGNDRVQKFDSDGVYLAQWGTTGAGDGQFNAPQFLAVDDDGNVYVVDSGNFRVQKFDSDGQFLAKWGTFGHGDGQFDFPYGVAVDGAGSVYVVDHFNYRVQKFDSDGVYLTKWGSSGFGDGQFPYGPFGAAVGGDGTVYVTDTEFQRVQRFDADGLFLAKWGVYGQGDGQFYYPSGVAVGGDGTVYVTDSANRRVQKFDSDGVFLATWGGEGTAFGQFGWPLGVAVDGEGNVYVVDPFHDRIQKFGGCGHPFSDVPNWVIGAVNWASCGEHLSGYPDNTFGPDLAMTRGEVARFLYRVAGSPDVSGLPPHGFSDVPVWVDDAVRWLAGNGHVTGYPDGTFRPDFDISRGALTRMQFRIAGSPSGSPPHPFNDVPAWVADAVNWIVDPAHDPPHASGYGDDTYRPGLEITRAQTTRITCRISAAPATC